MKEVGHKQGGPQHPPHRLFHHENLPHLNSLRSPHEDRAPSDLCIGSLSEPSIPDHDFMDEDPPFAPTSPLPHNLMDKEGLDNI
jgi:hypothetical protein